MPSGQSKYHYLDLTPETCVRNGHKFKRRDLQFWGTGKCFAQEDLYTTRWGALENVDIEKYFFGKIDSSGKKAVEYFSDFAHPDVHDTAFHDLMTYMSVQKLRTPKGLRWLRAVTRAPDRNTVLITLQGIQNMFCAIWTECVWQIANATNSQTKFIISDQPVTIYNRACFPGSKWCLGVNDPDVRCVGSHTYFPLSLDKVLILTNLSWARNPYQDAMKLRPNPNYFRGSIFNFTAIHTHRDLSEQEVLEINYITKKRALRYVAAAELDWLYPEKFLQSTHWSKFGDGLLFMPDPRNLHMGGEIIIGYSGGRSDAFSEYGHKPWQKGFRDEKRFAEESGTLEKFKSEFARRHGRKYRSSSFDFHRVGPHEDSHEMHDHYLRR